MAATERVVVLMSPAEKSRIEARAAALGRSTGDYMRRAADAHDESAEGDAAQLAALLPVFKTLHTETLGRLDHAERVLDETIAYLRAARSA